ncbi:alanine--tRNA ligase [archaeon]|nr:alanine--tRNA ligase [archaeon]|tara:strand:+ start:13736 stop:16234 length:2499 start_codon:yes stop_codon:yes gene_type:complete
MLDNKKIKEDLRKKAFSKPEKYYPVDVLKSLGYILNKCKNCKRIFYTLEEKDLCGEGNCSGGFRFINDSPARNKLDYIGAWKEFSNILKKKGYAEIKRYPVVARWRKDEYWVGASIYDFQPYVVSGEVEPPANPLIVPQLCMRFNDIDNVGITGAHYSCFLMSGQHAFVPSEKYDIGKYFSDLHEFFLRGLKIPKDELYIMPDSWTGGGNAGVSCEFFSRGLELANQVYMQYEVLDKGLRELKIKVLDMGMGHERVSWFSQGKSTSYETTFPTIVRKLKKITNIKVDNDLMKNFLPYSSYLNIDEVDNIDKTWKDISKKVGYDVSELKNKILELGAMYSIGEHSRALLVSLSDGALPSNVGGGYNLRILYRRALSFIDQYNWEVDFLSLVEEHANYLRPLFPELSENLNDVQKILDVEKSKYENTKEKSRKLISGLIKKNIDENLLLEVYNSQGINPELIKEEASKLKKKVDIPDDFYLKVSELNEKKEQKHQTKKSDLSLDNVQETEALYLKDYKKTENKGKILKIIKDLVVLDKTVAYPTSGGQLHDLGKVNGIEIIDVIKQGNVILHKLKEKPNFKVNDTVSVKINLERRLLLTVHHDAAHILNGAAKKVLGNHINQASAFKDTEKGHLDITHYQSLKEEEIKEIEDCANAIIDKRISIDSDIVLRNDAEKEFGMGIYQGGAIPGKYLRIVSIKGFDVEACGGTHSENTSTVKLIKITKSSKISDSVVRLEYVAGQKAQNYLNKEKNLIGELSEILNIDKKYLIGRVEELFSKWKRIVKKGSDEVFVLESKVESKLGDEEVLEKLTQVLKTQKEHLVNTVSRFLKDLKK